MQTKVIIILLLSLATIIAIYSGLTSWHTHLQRRQAAAERGWRYTSTALQSLVQSVYVISGRTPKGVVWEMRRIRQNGRFYFWWSTKDVKLPYGRILIIPRREAIDPEKPTPIGLTTWQNSQVDHSPLADYLILTTHQQLGDQILTQEVTQALTDWPKWPMPGGLEDIKWSPNHLDIRVRYFDDWTTVNRLVSLGTSLVKTIH